MSQGKRIEILKPNGRSNFIQNWGDAGQHHDGNVCKFEDSTRYAGAIFGKCHHQAGKSANIS